MASMQIPFRVRSMATNGFNACRYSPKYGLDVDKDFKPIQPQGLAQLLAFFQRLFPELEDKQKYQLVFAGNIFFFTFYLYHHMQFIFQLQMLAVEIISC